MTQSMINSLRAAVTIRKERVEAIERIAKVMREQSVNMNLDQLLDAKEEVAELMKELEDHERFLKKAQKTIAEFYKPPVEV